MSEAWWVYQLVFVLLGSRVLHDGGNDMIFLTGPCWGALKYGLRSEFLGQVLGWSQRKSLIKCEDAKDIKVKPCWSARTSLRFHRWKSRSQTSDNMDRRSSRGGKSQRREEHVLLTFDKVHTIPCACHPKWHLNVKKWSEHVVFLTCWLRSVLRTTTACAFSTSQLPKVLRTWCALYMLTSKFASRHNGVHFSTSQLPKVLRTWCALYIWLRNLLRATTACTFSTSQLPKVVREWCALYVLTSKCASRHNSMHFFDISTSKKAPNVRCF